MAKGKELTPVVKLSKTRVKLSVSGPVCTLRGQSADAPSTVMYYEQGYHGVNALQVFYDGSKQGFEKFNHPALLEEFSEKQRRALCDFGNAAPHQRVLSDEIIRIQDETFAKYGRSRRDYKV